LHCGHGIDLPFYPEIAIDGMVSVNIPIDGIRKRSISSDEIL
jgi:hypothetical protein